MDYANSKTSGWFSQSLTWSRANSLKTSGINFTMWSSRRKKTSTLTQSCVIWTTSSRQRRSTKIRPCSTKTLPYTSVHRSGEGRERRRRENKIPTLATFAIHRSTRRHSATSRSLCLFDDDVFAQPHSAIGACAKNTPQRHANADRVNTVESNTMNSCVRIENAGAQDPLRVMIPDREKVATVVITVIDRRPGIAIPREAHLGAEDAPEVRHTIAITAHTRMIDTTMDRIGEKDRTRQGDDIDLQPLTLHSSPPGETATTIAPEDHFRVHHRSTLYRRRITSLNSSNRHI